MASGNQMIQMMGRFIKDPLIRFNYLSKLGLKRHLSDEAYIKKVYRLTTGMDLNLEQPKTFNEKTQWLKLYDRNPLYTKLVDKYLVKQYVSERIGTEHVIPLLGGPWKSCSEIDFSSLPNAFVLKCTHDSGGVVICRDKKIFDFSEAEIKLEQCLKINYYDISREWPYRDCPPRLIAEQYMTDESGTELKDYKVFCFGGDPRLIEVDFDRFDGHKRNLYQTDWKLIPEEIKYPSDPAREILKPDKLDEMLEYAHVLSEGMPFVRIDFYITRDTVYFGEYTFYHGSGTERFSSREMELQMGDWIRLPQKTVEGIV